MTNTHQGRNCEECGARLRAWDFVNGRAVLSGSHSYCASCRPGAASVPTPMPDPQGETRWRRRRNQQLL
jgi:hypothetical protein